MAAVSAREDLNGAYQLKHVEVYVDSERASDASSRRSTIGAVILSHETRIHKCSRGRATVALSICEATPFVAAEGRTAALLHCVFLTFVGICDYMLQVKVGNSATHKGT